MESPNTSLCSGTGTPRAVHPGGLAPPKESTFLPSPLGACPCNGKISIKCFCTSHCHDSPRIMSHDQLSTHFHTNLIAKSMHIYHLMSIPMEDTGAVRLAGDENWNFMGFRGKYRNISVVLRVKTCQHSEHWILDRGEQLIPPGKGHPGYLLMLTQGQPLLSWVPVLLFQSSGKGWGIGGGATAIEMQSPSHATFLHCLMGSSSPLSPPSLTSPDKPTFSSQFPN